MNNKNKNKKKSQKQEKRLSKEFEARTTASSGSFRYDKGDLENSEYLIEAKYTEKSNISIKGEWISKIIIEASYKGKIPLIVFTIDGIANCFAKDFVILRLNDFKKLKDKNV